MRRHAVVVAGALVVAAFGFGCEAEPTAEGDPTVVTSVTPAGGAVDVDPAGPVLITFSGPMQMGMEMYAALHESGVAGPGVAGTWSWMDNGTRLTFTPDQPLAAGTAYTIHLGGGMMDADGARLGLDSCVRQHGGQWATEGMMGGGMMGGRDMMGAGWRGAGDTYGMLYTFTTR